MILGVGVDLVDIERMAQTMESRWWDRFRERVFSREEIAVCEAAPAPVQAYAARFAAKEAVAKALGTGFTRGVAAGGIVVIGGEKGRPTIELRSGAWEMGKALGVGRVHLSLSHTPASACAVVVIEA